MFRRNPRVRAGSAAYPDRRPRFEALEDRRVLAPLVGVELGTGPAPTNWTTIASVGPESNPTFITNLIDETGAATEIDLEIVATYEGGGENVATEIDPDVLPQHTQSLAAIDNSVQIDSEVGVHSFIARWKGLNPATEYEIYVFAAESTINYADNQKVTILGSGPNDEFFQMPSSFDGNLWINGDTTSNAQPLSSYSLVKTPFAFGEIDIVITMQLDSDVVVLTALAIRDTSEPPPPISADFVTDSVIDGRDYLAWQRGFGKTLGAVRADGDADNDHDVDSGDLVVWKNTFGASVAAAEPIIAASDGPLFAAASTAPAISSALPQARLTPETADAALTLIAAPRPTAPPRLVRLGLDPAFPAGASQNVAQPTDSAAPLVSDLAAPRSSDDDGTSGVALDTVAASLDLALAAFDAAT